jgi:nucleoside-diphosphate-sugar epimerase
MTKKVLLTGATGFIAAHVLDILLHRGYIVRAAVRSLDKGQALLTTRQAYKDKVEFAIVQDISVLGAFDDAVKGVDGVLHVASPFQFKVTDNEKDLLIPAINGTKSVLLAAAKEPSVKRVVITSSIVSIVDGSKGLRPGHVYTVNDWNPVTYEQAKDTKITPIAYAASKVLAEKTAWDFLEKEGKGVHFDIVTLCPPMVFGPIVSPLHKLSELNTSNASLWALASGKLAEVPPTPSPLFVDVRDLALAHVEALERPEASNKRYGLSAGHYSNQQAADILRAKFDWAQDRVPKGNPGKYEDSYTLESTPAQKELGIHFRGFEETLVDAITQFKEFEAQGK